MISITMTNRGFQKKKEKKRKKRWVGLISGLNSLGGLELDNTISVLESTGAVVLSHVKTDLGALTDNLLLVGGTLSENVLDSRDSDGTKSLDRLVAHHAVLLRSPDDVVEGLSSAGVGHLTQHKGDLVLQQSTGLIR